MYTTDLSSRLRAHNIDANTDSLNHASALAREMVNPLESVNNLAYLLTLSTQHPAQAEQLVAMLQSLWRRCMQRGPMLLICSSPTS